MLGKKVHHYDGKTKWKQIMRIRGKEDLFFFPNKQLPETFTLKVYLLSTSFYQFNRRRTNVILIYRPRNER